MLSLTEGLIFGEKAGLDMPKVVTLLQGGAAGCSTLRLYGDRILKKDYAPGAYTDILLKDLRFCQE